jgi:hypothetical protein
MQMAAHLSFEWSRALARHEIAPPTKIWERWANLAGRPIRHESLPLPEVWLHRVKARVGRWETYEPLKDAGLYQRFARLDFEPESYRSFADRFGLLTASDSTTLWTFASFHACLRQALGQKVPKWLLQQIAHRTRDLVAKLHSRGAQALEIDNVLHGWGPPGPGTTAQTGISRLSRLIESRCTTKVEISPLHGHTTLVIRPRDLMVAIALQAVRHLSGEDERMGVKLLSCKRCSEPFKVGPKTDRRPTSMFCSRRCQNAFTYAARKAGRKLAKPG